jgi:hypothetical protein
MHEFSVWAAPLLVTATVAAGSPQPPPSATSYLVTSTIASAQGTVTAEELLTFVAEGGATFAMLHDRGGGSTSAAVHVNANGTVAAERADPAIACYNVAMEVLSDGGSAKSATSSVMVALPSMAVRIPIRLQSAESPDGTHGIAAGGSTLIVVPDGGAGTPVRLVVEGSVTTRERTLLSARFVETTVEAATGGVLAQTACAVSRVLLRTSATTLI